MQNPIQSLLFLTSLSLPVVCPLARAGVATTVLEDSHDDAVMNRVMGLEEMSNAVGQESIRSFIKNHVAGDYAASIGEDALAKLLMQVREKCGNAGGIGVAADGESGVKITFESAAGVWDVRMIFEAESPYKITKITLGEGEARPSLPPFTWSDIEGRLESYEREGLRAAVIVVRDGEVVLDRGYGMANEELGAKNTTETMFAIGSTPIDFTKAAILLLEDRKQLSTDDLLSKYFDVPKDKAAITLKHLMIGASGLRNFHGIRGVDEDLDLSYIDRKEALRRIFDQELLFAPGTRRVHSHSAWGVLAAVVEKVSGKSYGEFLEEQLFEPAGMTRTGLYPITRKFEDTEIAVGQASSPLSPVSSPKLWGETSWLVMGSGGMVSTAADLYAWLEAIRSGKLLSERAQREFWTGQTLAGGNDRGFVTVYTEGPENISIFLSNSHSRAHDMPSMIGEGLARLANSSEPNHFSFGIMARVDEEVVVDSIVPESAAATAGLRAGDRILRIDGYDALDSFGALLKAAARTGKSVNLEIEREGKALAISVQPRRSGS